MTHLTAQQRRQSLSRWCDVLESWRVRSEVALQSWTLTRAGFPAVPLALGAAWTPTPDDLPVLLEFVGTLEHPLEEAWLELDLGGEGDVKVFLEGREVASGGLNPYHRLFRLGSVTVGQTLEVRAEVVARNFFGRPNPAPALSVARIVVLEKDLLDLVLDLRVALEVVAELEGPQNDGSKTNGSKNEGHDAVPHLLGMAEEAIDLLEWPSDTLAVLGRGRDALGEWYAAGIWRLPEFPPAQPLTKRARDSVDRARAHLKVELERLKVRYPARGHLSVNGHAHIDLGWLWPVHETRRKIVRTFRSVLELMGENPDFTFNQSSAQAYAWLEEDDPELFARVREKVLEGRIETVGGTWVEPDGQMPSGESWARQFLYGQRYFEQKFGQRSSVLWLPDTFGYAPALPQILKGAGISGFFTTKLSWNETNRFPHDLFAWEGLDGTRVTAHMFSNPGGSSEGTGAYNGEFKPRDLSGVWQNYRGKNLRVWGEQTPSSLFTYGYGDGGGGPSREHLERFERLRDYPAMPRLEHSRVDHFFAGLPSQNLPVWRGELYLELHRATLTSQGRIKKLNRAAEHRLVEAETLASLNWLRGAEYPAGVLERAWKTVLLNQFHDILPGSSIAEVYAVAVPELEGVLGDAQNLVAGVGRGAEGWTVFNAALGSRPLWTVLPGAQAPILNLEGQSLPTQQVEGGVLVFEGGPFVPQLGGSRLMPGEPNTPAPHSAGEGAVTLEQTEGSWVLDNGRVRVEIGADGTIGRMYDLKAARDLFKGRGNRLVAYPDLPRDWEAWDTTTSSAQGGEELLEVHSIEILETGPLRAAVKVTRKWRSSTVVQTYRLGLNSARVDLETHLDWHERRTLLRALFPLHIHAPYASFETAFGAVTRPTHRNTSWDMARFEVCGHRWADLSESGYGVALLNNGKYGHEVLGNTLALSLVRGPMFPDPRADEGEHHFTYSLYPHVGDAAQGGVALEALDLNSPLMVLPGALENPLEGFALTGLPLMLSALKKAEDSDALILRMFETYGARGRVEFKIPGVRSVFRVNLLEDLAERVMLEGNIFSLEVRPFEIVSLRLEFER